MVGVNSRPVRAAALAAVVAVYIVGPGRCQGSLDPTMDWLLQLIEVSGEMRNNRRDER